VNKILISIPIYGSYCVFLKGLAVYLHERGWEVHVATNLSGSNVKKDVAFFHNVPMPRGAKPHKLLQASRDLTQIIKDIKPSVVHAHFSVGVLVLALAKRVPGIRYFGTFQGMRFPMDTGLMHLVYKLLECFSIIRLDKIWVLTEDDFKSVPNFLQRKLAVQKGYGFGCDIDHFDPACFTDEDKIRKRNEIGIQHNEFVFIFIGRLTAFKGFDLALQAFLRLRELRSDVHFIVVGETDSVHPLDLPDLKQLEGVHAVGWQSDLAPYLAIADAMVFPSEREGMPVCIMEALAMGVPVITTHARGCDSLVEDGRTGWKVTRDVDSIFAAMRSSTKYQLAVIGEAREEIRKCYARQHFYRIVEETLG
jgi:glycosyltransferase involved in cell wall biosynthesis